MREVTEKRMGSVSLLLVALAIFLCASAAPAQQAGADDWKAVAQAMGKAGAVQPGDVYKISLPRSDLQVTARGMHLKSALALGSWSVSADDPKACACWRSGVDVGWELRSSSKDKDH